MKRFLGILLAMCMTLGSVPAFAAESDSAQMQEALAYVKSRVQVPDELNKFSSSVSENEKGEETQYSFVWRDEDDKKSVRVTTDKTSKIMEYRLYDRDEEYDSAKFNKVTVEAAKSAADSFLATTVPEKAEKLRFVSSDDNGSYYRYQYIHEENGYPVKDESVVVTIRIRNQQDTVVTDMNVSEWTMDGFTVPENDIGIDKAKEIYKDKGGYELVYRRDYLNDKLYLVYAAKDDVKYFDAATGEEVEYNKDFAFVRDNGSNVFAAKSAVSGGAAEDAAIEFSREELEEIERVEGMLSAEEVVEKLRAIPEIDVPDGDILSKSIYKTHYKDKDNKQYTMSLRIGTDEKSASAAVDAMTGELLSFYNYSSDVYANPIKDENKKAYTDEQKNEAENTIDGFVKEYAPTYYAQARENEDYYYDRYLSKNYTRVIDGIPYYSNGITVRYDMETGKVMSFSVNFELVTNMTDKSEIKLDLGGAYDKVFENAGLIKEYIVSSGEAPKLVYTLEKPDYMTIDAVTGKSVGWNGREIKEKITDYSDISGHWAQEYIERLAKVGYSVDSDKFRPDDAITQKDFLWMITGGGAGDEEQMYKDLISQKIIEENEKNPDAPITKEQAIVYLMNWNGYREVANLEGIYVTGFADEDKMSKVGYVALAKGFGIVTGDTDNCFHPEKQITRAEAATMLYKLLDR